MKIRCDVCDQAEASVFCSADEAALCDGCDHRVHHANKLASKHMRFSLLQPNSLPLCDICQERRALLFCREDRAILCRECDVSIHKANELTQKHNRFLLTGVKLSASSSSYSSISSSSTSLKRPTTRETFNSNLDGGIENGSISTSSISEYLENLPGWRVDDLLEVDPSFASKIWEPNLELVDRQHLESHWRSSSSTSGGFWVLQGSPESPLFVPRDGLLKEPKEANSQRKWDEGGFTVPQIRISPPSVKKSRQL